MDYLDNGDGPPPLSEEARAIFDKWAKEREAEKVLAKVKEEEAERGDFAKGKNRNSSNAARHPVNEQRECTRIVLGTFPQQ